MVKITAITHEGAIMCLKAMEEKGVQIPLITLEMDTEETVNFFRKLLAEGKNNEVSFDMQTDMSAEKVMPDEKTGGVSVKMQGDKDTKKVASDKLKPDAEQQVSKKPRQLSGPLSVMVEEKILGILQADKPLRAKEISNELGIKYSSVSTCLRRMIAKGIVMKCKRGEYQLYQKEFTGDEDKPVAESEKSASLEEEPVTESEEPASLEEEPVKESEKTVDIEKKHEEMATTEIDVLKKELFQPDSDEYQELHEKIVEYIFTKNNFLVEDLRKKFAGDDFILVEILKLARQGNFIREKGEGKYEIPFEWRVWYYLFQANRRISVNKICVDLQLSFIYANHMLEEVRKKGIIKRTKVNNEVICYEAVI